MVCDSSGPEPELRLTFASENWRSVWRPTATSC